MENSYIPCCILRLNKQIERDPVLIQAMRLVFDWANKNGLAGKKVYNLKLDDPSADPLSLSYGLWCMVECTEEERKAWEKHREILIRAEFGILPMDEI
jgi:hypothetical protein